MRLINVESLQLVEFSEREPPLYAILSHTWGEEEVTFNDITHGHDYQKKAGYSKLRGVANVTRGLGLGYAWIDTCCIDKSSSAELSETINSMYLWYRNAAVCYAFLEDVLPTADNGPLEEASLRQSRWFTRGWTLQELLAPRHVQFYDQQWNLRGIKSEQPTRGILSRITHIDEDILLDCDLVSEVSVAQRMSWASQRKTTKPEDMAYCLMGIFGVRMPVVYGGGENTFIRLQEEIIKDLDELSILAWASPSHKKQRFSGVLAHSPSDFGHIWTSGCRWRQPPLFEGDMFSTSKGLSIVADFVSLGSEVVLDLGNIGGGPHRYGVLLVEVNGVFVRLSPDLVLVGKYGDYFPKDLEITQDGGPIRIPKESSAFREAFRTRERSISMKAILKRVLDRRTGKFLEQRFKSRSPWSSGSGTFRALAPRRFRQKQHCLPRLERKQSSRSLAPAQEDTLSESSWCVVEGQDIAGIPPPASWPRNLVHKIFGCHQDRQNRYHSDRSEPWEDVSLIADHFANARTSSTCEINGKAGDLGNVDGPVFQPSDRSPSDMPFDTAPSHHQFLAGKNDLVHGALRCFEAWLADASHFLLRSQSKTVPEDVEEFRNKLLLSPSPTLFACPYWKRDAVRYHACLISEAFSEVQDVSQHLWDEHCQPYYCPTCFEQFQDRSDWGVHVRRQECDCQPPREIEGIRDNQKDSIDAAADQDGRMEDRWFAIWDAAFPGEERPSSPFLDGRAGSLAVLARRFWKEYGETMVSDFARRHNLLQWKTAGEERGLGLLYEAVLVDLIDLSVRSGRIRPADGGHDCAGAMAMDVGTEETGGISVKEAPEPNDGVSALNAEDDNDVPETTVLQDTSYVKQPTAVAGTPCTYRPIDCIENPYECYPGPSRLPTRPAAAPSFDISVLPQDGTAISSHSTTYSDKFPSTACLDDSIQATTVTTSELAANQVRPEQETTE